MGGRSVVLRMKRDCETWERGGKDVGDLYYIVSQGVTS